MSNKNLKVYRIQFMTEIGEMPFKVKFPCQLKVVWKRSNEVAQTTPVAIEKGVVNFNQTLKMYVNMYFDTEAQKFVEKKCLYSFLILTDKGEKSAGSVTCDLSELFNKRLYELKQQFTLQKCPLPDTKVSMKIYYEQSTEQGYNSIDQMSVTPDLDMSTPSVDLSELGHHQPQKVEEKNQDSDSTSKADSSTQQILSESNYDILNQSDLGDRRTENQKISENIQALDLLSGKIEDFVSKCSGNIRSELESLKQSNKELREQLTEETIRKQKAEQKAENLRAELAETEKTLKHERAENESSKQELQSTIEDVSSKLKQKTELYNKLQASFEEKGESQNSYLTNLKLSYEQNERKLKEKISQLNNQLLEQKKIGIEKQEANKKLKQEHSNLIEKYSHAEEKCAELSRKQINRERQLSEIRARFESVYQRMVKQLGSLK